MRPDDDVEDVDDGAHRTPWACRLLGHRPEFDVMGATLWWRCVRGCGDGGTRAYGSESEARRYARLLNDSAPHPPVGLLSALGGMLHREPHRRVP